MSNCWHDNIVLSYAYLFLIFIVMADFNTISIHQILC